MTRLITLTLTLLLLTSCARTPADPDPGYEDFRVESFDLIDTEGEPTDETILDSRYTVVDFIFTNCPIYCPAMGAVMRRVQDETANTDARLLSISVDGTNDTPEVLAAYAESLGADTSRWTFLTGDRAHVKALAEQQLYLGVDTDPTRPVTLADGSTMDFIEHPTRLVLVGPDRQVLGMYSYARSEEIDRLIQRVRRIAPERASP
jgi:cytochrome oxidase Cu insertion factor (SCO1/SenC/PrrC family)